MPCYTCYTTLDHCQCEKRPHTLQEYVESFRNHRELSEWERSQETVTISLETAEYLSVLLGQTNWGNKIRRRHAGTDLSEALGSRKLTKTFECFNDSIK